MAGPSTPPIKISVLVSVRKNSKYLAKFLFGYLAQTVRPETIDVHIMINEHDTWNSDLIKYFSAKEGFHFYRENLGLGRHGLHEYLNSMVKETAGDWLVYFCDDHFIIMAGWDAYIRSTIELSNLDPNKVWCIIPKFDNVGAMNQILSKGYVRALGGKLGRHGWIDSYVNDLNDSIPDRVLRLDHETFHDFTHDKPNMLDDVHTRPANPEKGLRLPAYKSLTYKRYVREDQQKLTDAIKKEEQHGLQG